MNLPSSIFVLLALSGDSFAQNLESETKYFAFVPNDEVELGFEKFDTQGGSRVLTGVTVSFDFSKTGGSLAVDNDSARSGIIFLSHTVEGVLSSTDVRLGSSTTGDSGNTLYANSSITAVIAPTSGDSRRTFNVTNASDYFLFEPNDVSVETSHAVNTLFLGDYVGSGDFTLVFAATQLVTATGIGGLQQAFTISDVGGSVKVSYSYALIPEPSVLMLAGTILPGLLFRRRR